MNALTVDELLDVVDVAIAAVLRAAGWQQGQRADEWIDPASGKTCSTEWALVLVRKDARR